jgi:hypothetical protein
LTPRSSDWDDTTILRADTLEAGDDHIERPRHRSG